jgi:hypothetical protein
MVGAIVAPPAVFGAPVSYGVGGAGEGAGAATRAVPPFGAAARGFGGGLRLLDTVMVGSCMLPKGRDCAFGEAAAGGGAFCAGAPAQRDDSRTDADASKRARNDTKTPAPRRTIACDFSLPQRGRRSDGPAVTVATLSMMMSIKVHT